MCVVQILFNKLNFFTILLHIVAPVGNALGASRVVGLGLVPKEKIGD